MATTTHERRLTRAPAAPAGQNAAPGERTAAASDPIEILVVDDVTANLMAMEAALAPLGCSLVLASSGEEAIQLCREHDFALILLDVQMPSMNGFEAARAIRGAEGTFRAPIIFVTAFGRDEAEMMRAYELGAVDFLFKPVVPAMLCAKVAVFVELRRRNLQVVRQAERLNEHRRKEQERLFQDERSRWETAVLRRERDQQQVLLEEISRHARELSRTIADREHAERELSRINEELEVADKRKDEFLAMLAHELRNPLAPIVAGLELIDERELSCPVHVRARQTIKRQVDHLTRLVDDLLDVARITSGKIELRPETLELSTLVEHAVATSMPMIDKAGHQLVVSAPTAPVALVGDPVRLGQVVSNLLNNAARYTDPGGKIEIEGSREGSDVVIRVSDNGRGIRPELLDRVFDLFVRSEPAGGDGLGLGLTLVKRLVELHGGTVGALSRGPGQGSTFIVRIPTAVEPVTSGARAESFDRPDSTPAAPGTIVIIEDNVDVRETLCVLLARWGFRVSASDNGADGVELVKRVRPDVALVDIGMPGLDGYCVAGRLRSEMAADSPRLVAMTGYGQVHDRQRALDAGFDIHLVKPVDPGVLRRILSGASTR